MPIGRWQRQQEKNACMIRTMSVRPLMLIGKIQKLEHALWCSQKVLRWIF